ncbi:PTS sugar transporter subunit IIA [uncultured Anaerococcus sp.]|uniref:PTS sugar transporter subunit IIA n=1 Tax=uncultured Anaerococcus sp. TaxID=293428 RepID=UPI0025E0359A|nr:PTS sugar transporter subunit IIA [uncultured Anaerococcus sp.]
MKKSKNGILIASHGSLAKEILKTSSLFLGSFNSDRVDAVGLYEEGGFGKFSDEINEKVNFLLEKNDKVIIITDLFGGTPNNEAMKISMSNSRVEVVSGFNLALLIEVLSMIDQEIIDVKEVVDIGKKSIISDRELNVSRDDNDEEELCL